MLGSRRAAHSAGATALALLLGACTTATPASAPPSAAPTTGAPTTGASGAAAGSPTPAPAVTKTFTFAPDAVVDTKLASTEDLYINPGALIEVDGTLHMFPNSFSTWPGRMKIPHLTSSDGVTWTLDTKAAVLDTDTSGLFPMADPGIDISTGFVTDAGTWTLLFENVSNTDPWKVYRMTATSPAGPWTVDPKPVLDVGAAGDFDATGVQWPSVVRIGNRWAAYYAGVRGAGRGTGQIGVAFSDDGVTWTKQPGSLLQATEAWELRSLDRPRVVSTPSGLVMLYTALDLNRRALATSTDGLAWTKVPGPSIEQKDFPLQGGSWDSALRYADGSLQYFLEIGNQTTSIYRATLAWP
ncbi:MAG TPA: hypothetical protein VHR16_02340 [Candidatus Limnocylindrales bacterium]|nr:hypothetical protein [Candidatus Limnocylindrales bacterium]